MPKFLDAILAGTLIAFSPEMLQITFVHAETVDSPAEPVNDFETLPIAIY